MFVLVSTFYCLGMIPFLTFSVQRQLQSNITGHTLFVLLANVCSIHTAEAFKMSPGDFLRMKILESETTNETQPSAGGASV